jgi:hypothetical protein
VRENIINESIARQLVGQQFMGGSFVSYETRNGKTTMTAKCSQCGGPHSGISVTNAAQAANNPTTRLIGCQHCTYVSPSAKKETLADVLAIPESRRSSAQQRIVVEAEQAERVAQRQAPIKAAQAQASRAVKGALWEHRERYLQTVAHSNGVQTIADPRVLNDPAYFTWQQWIEATDEDRDKIIALTNDYFQANGLR